MNFLELPNEITLAVLENLKKNHIKRIRLVCKKLASLGGPFLFDVIYISQHPKNVEVFEAISQHPAFSASVKNVVYDSVKFFDYTLETYCKAIRQQYIAWSRRELRIADPAIWELMDPKDTMVLQTVLKRCQGNAAFMEGYRQYCLLAQAERADVKSPWFVRAVEGLRKLGPIQSVTIRNTWDMVYDDDIARDIWQDISEDNSDYDEMMDNRFNAVENKEDDWEDCGSSDASLSGHALGRAPGLRADGTRLVGSPLARAWPYSRLQPTSIGRSLCNAELKELSERFHIPEWLCVDWAFDNLVQLLVSADQQPLEFCIPSNGENEQALSTYHLGSHNLSLDLSFAENLQSLFLAVASLERETTTLLLPDLPLLKVFLKTTKLLTGLTLDLPIEQNHSIFSDEDSDADQGDGYALFQFTQIFPPLQDLQITHLRTLNLSGLEITYRNLAGLLFLKAPNLTCLSLSHIQLAKGGHWEDIIEGLRHLHHLDACFFITLLYPNFQEYPDEVTAAASLSLDAHSRYVVSGGRHPDLDEEEPDNTSLIYLERLNETLNILKKTTGASVK